MVNVVILAGHLCADPELRYTAGGAGVASLRLAVNSSYKTAAGERRESVLFIDVTVWGKMAEACSEYLTKGSKVLVHGELRQREWDDRRTGQKVSKIDVNARQVTFLNAKTKPTNGASPVSVGTETPEAAEDDVPF